MHDSLSVLLDVDTVDKMRELCAEHAKSTEKTMSSKLEAMFFGPSPSEVLYNLEVVYSMLMPAHNPLSEEAFEFQVSWMLLTITQYDF